jgi:hypothetical protein
MPLPSQLNRGRDKGVIADHNRENLQLAIANRLEVLTEIEIGGEIEVEDEVEIEFEHEI